MKPQGGARSALGAGLVAALLAGACRNPQRAPEPMPLPGGEEATESTVPENPYGEDLEVSVVRHSDDVRVQRPGANAASPLTFYRKKTRLGPGGRVFTGYGGRVELLWPGDTSTVMMEGPGAVVLGELESDEPFVRFLDISRARLSLTPEDRVGLPGGAVLRGDAVFPSGPFSVERVGPEMLRVRNQSHRAGRIDYRSASLLLAPGDDVDLPLLSFGTAPTHPDPGATRVETGVVDFTFSGRVAWSIVEGRVRVVAEDVSEVEALGLRVRLDPGEEILLAPLEAYVTRGAIRERRDSADDGL